MKKLVLYIGLLISGFANAQYCDPLTPVFNIDLTGQPNGVWLSPPVLRQGLCCGASNPDRCLQFNLTLDSMAQMINFSVASGAMPTGALFYQINCGTPTPVGTPICLNGPGPYVITFCKPGNNLNTYQITSIGQPALQGPGIVSQACSGLMTVNGLIESSIQWSSVPANPTYDSYLSCMTGCDSVLVVPPGTNIPPYIDYQVTGTIQGPCMTGTFTDSVRIYFVNDLAVNINPQSVVLCNGLSDTLVTAQATGGLPPYKYAWSTGDTSASVRLQVGTFYVMVRDARNCSVAYDTITVTRVTGIITANAGPDVVVCSNTTSIQLNGSITTATGAYWSGGGGTYTPDSTKLTAIYHPSALDIASGGTILILTTTGNGGCPAATDQMRITINPQPDAVITGVSSVCLNTVESYQAVNISGYSYTWNVTGGQIVTNANNEIAVQWNTVGTGAISLTVQNSFGCDSSVSMFVAVNPLPAPVITGPIIVCTDATVSYSTALNPLNSYSWSVTNGVISGGQNTNSIDVSFTGNGTSSILVTEINPFTCSTTSSLTVQRVQSPFPVITGTTSLCENTTATYSANSALISSWSVTGGTVVSSNSRFITIFWDLAGTGSVTLFQSSGYGCDASITMNVTINPLPVPSITGPLTVCTDETFTYSTGLNAASTYDWTITSGQIVSGLNTNSVDIALSGSGISIVSVTETNSFGCQRTASDTIIRIQKPAPVIAGTILLCASTVQTYTTTVPAGVTSSWTVSGGTVVNTSVDSITVLWNTPGTGVVSVTQASAAGCDSVVSIIVTVNPLPAPVISGMSIVCTNDTYTYFTNANTGSIYNWSVVNGTIVSGLLTNSINVYLTGSGNTILTLTEINSFGCSTTVSDTIVRIQKPAPVITGQVTVCQNTTSVYTTSVPVGVTSLWSVSGGTMQTVSPSAISVLWSTAGTGTISLVQSAGNGCDTVITYTVTVNPLPRITLTGPAEICELHSATYLASPGDPLATFDLSISGNASMTTVSSNSATVYFPTEGNANIHVTVTNVFGCQSEADFPILIHRQPLAQFSGPVVVCKNSTAIYSAVNVNDVNTWTVTGGTVLSSTNQDVTVQWTDSVSGSVTLFASNPGFCDTSMTFTVTILPAPTPVITGNQVVCGNRPSVFSVSGMLPGDNITWSVDHGRILTSNTAASINVFFANAGADTIRVTVVGANGCDINVDYPIVVLDGPAPMLTGTDPVCRTDTGTYSVPFKQGHLYQWTVVGGTIISFNITNTIDVYWFLDGQGSVTCRQISPDGCDSIVSMNVFVKPLPTPLVSGPFQICQYENASFSLTSNTGSSYAWNIDGIPIQNSSTYYQNTWTSPGIHTINVTEVNSFGCSLSAQAMVSVGEKPVPVIQGRPTACLNAGLQRYTVPATPNTNYHWTVSAGGYITAGAYDDTVSVRWNQVGTFQINLHAVNRLTGCDSIVSMTIVSDTIRKPVINAGLSGCSPVTVSVTGNQENPDYSYTWNFGDGTTSSSANPSHLYSTPGNYNIRVVVNSAFGCKDSLNNVVVVHPDPVASFQLQNERDYFMAGMEPIVLDNNSIGGMHYDWAFGNGEVSTDYQPELMYQEAGVYMITLLVTNSFGCIDTMQHPLEIRVPEDIFIPNAFTPNGDNVNDYFTMTFLNIKEARVHIFNRWGEEIYSSKDLTFKWDGSVKGRTVQNEVYVYLVEAEGIYGTTFKRTGKITVFH